MKETKTCRQENVLFSRYWTSFLLSFRCSTKRFSVKHLSLFRRYNILLFLFPLISEQIIDKCFADIPIEIDRAFVKAFVLNGQRIVNEIIF